MKKNDIDLLFETSKHQIDIALALYRIAFKNFDDIKTIDGHPVVSRETNEYLFESFINFDKKNHPEAMPGGLWMNKGFGTSEKPLKFGEIDTSTCTVTV